MQSLNYVLAAYLFALLMLGTFTFGVVRQRLKLRALFTLMENLDFNDAKL